MHRVFSARYELTWKFETLRKRVSSATTCNSWIAKSFLGQARISIKKWLIIMKKQSGGLCSQSRSSWAQVRLLTGFMTLQRRHHKLSRDTKIIENKHQEPRQLCVGKLTKVRKLCWKSDTFFHSRDRLRIVRRVFPTFYELVHKSGTLRKRVTSAATCNSRFVSNISGLAGIFVRKTQKNYSNTTASRNHTFSVQAPIWANLRSLEIRLLELSNGTMYDLFWTP